jgi:hypothetical protein
MRVLYPMLVKSYNHLHLVGDVAFVFVIKMLIKIVDYIFSR